MNKERLGYLLDQYEGGHATPEELAELDDFYDRLGDPELELPAHIRLNMKAYTQERFRKLVAIIDQQKPIKRNKRRNVLLKVAAAVILIVLTGLLYTLIQNKFSHVSEPPAVVSYDVKADQATNSRYVLLPDGSVVILHAGSRITFDTTNFNVATRNVTLTGEAYFDVRHNPEKPFVIKVNDLIVTVLGTAFNIKQTDDSVAVTVTRGKVQVESNDKLLAVLTPGKQLTTVDRTRHAGLTNVPIGPVIAWMREGLHFENTTLGDAVAQLKSRYSAEITLKTAGIEHCSIAVVTAFKGTESLHDILDVICATLGASYEDKNGHIEITGEPCTQR